MKSKPTIERLHELFEYYEDGTLHRRPKPDRHGRLRFQLDVSAGTPPCRNMPYWRITIDGWHGYLHQVIFAYHRGYWPVEVDHDDQDKENNRINNLIERTHTENLNNRGPTARNVTGIKGVFPSYNGQFKGAAYNRG